MLLPSDSPTIAPFPEGWPVFDMPAIPRTIASDEQWERAEQDRAYHYMRMGIFLGLMQWVCTRLGNHRRCGLRACRRKGRCAGRRPQHAWNDGFLYPLVPPCEPTEFERVDQLRDEVNQVIWYWQCRIWDAPPPPPNRIAGVPLVFPDEQAPSPPPSSRKAERERRSQRCGP